MLFAKANMTSPISLPRVRRTLTDDPTPDAIIDAALAAVDTRFKCIADPTRLRILNLLAVGELCVCDVVDILALPQPTVSRHLGQLRRSGLVAATREWKFAHYRLSPARDAVHASILACVDAAAGTVPSLARERAEAARHAAERARQPCD
jgi:ArsR family transcriptional regulator, arsenate/arsenite/antimonite-responsive transcriptional repressor